MDENAVGTPVADTAGAAPAGPEPRGRFHDMTDGDHARDLLGLLALVLSLQLPWSSVGGPGADPWALAAVLLLVVPLALPYLARLGALPSSWTVHSTRRARVLLALPAVAAALAQVVLDALDVAGHRGVGAGVGIALAAAALAAVPRTSELGPVALDATVVHRWRATTVVVGVLAALAPLAWVALLVAERFRVPEPVRTADDLGGTLVVVGVGTGLLVCALVVPAVLAAFSRTSLWRRAAVVVAATWAAALFAGDAEGSVESVRSLVTAAFGQDVVVAGLQNLGYGLLLVGAVAVLATSPAVVRAATPEGDPAIGWFVTARGLLALTSVLAGVLAVVTVVVALEDGHAGLLESEESRSLLDALLEETPGLAALVSGSPGLAALLPGAVVALVVAVVALKVRSMLVGRPADARRPALAATAALLGLGIVLVVVARLDEADGLVPAAHVELLTLVVGVGLPAGVVACLTLPAAVRAHLAANPATPRPGGTASAYEWRPRVAAVRLAPPAAAPGAPGAPAAPAAPAPVTGTGVVGVDGHAVGGYPAAAYGQTLAPVAPAAPVAPQLGVTTGSAPLVGAVAPGPDGAVAPAPDGAVAPGPDGAVAPAPDDADSAPDHRGAPLQPLAQGAVAPEGLAVPAQAVPGSGAQDAAAAWPAADAAGAAPADVPASEQVTEVLRLDATELAAAGDGPSGAAASGPGALDPSSRSEAGFTWSEAIDPQTPAATLAQIAQDAPTLRAALAANPSTYPALVEWLGQLGDAEVDEALRSRTA